MGITDFVITIGIFVPKIAKPFLIYAVFWGITTALARLISPLTYGFSLDIVHQYSYLVLYRIPHGLVPVLILILGIKSTKKVNYTSEEDTLFV